MADNQDPNKHHHLEDKGKAVVESKCELPQPPHQKPVFRSAFELAERSKASTSDHVVLQVTLPSNSRPPSFVQTFVRMMANHTVLQLNLFVDKCRVSEYRGPHPSLEDSDEDDEDEDEDESEVVCVSDEELDDDSGEDSSDESLDLERCVNDSKVDLRGRIVEWVT